MEGGKKGKKEGRREGRREAKKEGRISIIPESNMILGLYSVLRKLLPP